MKSALRQEIERVAERLNESVTTVSARALKNSRRHKRLVDRDNREADDMERVLSYEKDQLKKKDIVP